jgi:hypothetical protein
MINIKSLSILALLILGSFQGVNGQLEPRGPVSFEPMEKPSLCPPDFSPKAAKYTPSLSEWEKTMDRPLFVEYPVIEKIAANGLCCLPLRTE